MSKDQTIFKLNAEINNMEEIKQQVEDLQEKLANMKISLTIKEDEVDDVWIATKKKLLKYLHSGKLIPTSESTRNIGKTAALREIAEEYNIPIITRAWHIPEYDTRHTEIFSISNIDELKGRRFDNGVLIEEGLTLEEIKKLKDMGIQIRTGYFYSELFI